MSQYVVSSQPPPVVHLLLVHSATSPSALGHFVLGPSFALEQHGHPSVSLSVGDSHRKQASVVPVLVASAAGATTLSHSHVFAACPVSVHLMLAAPSGPGVS